MCELFLSGRLPRAFRQWAFRGDRSHFHGRAIGQTGAIFGDRHRLVQTVHLKQEVAPDCFFGLRKRAIRHNPAVFARNDLALIHQWLAGFGLALLG